MNDYIIVKDNKIILSSEIIDALGANPGDRIVIEYTEYENTILPIILISDGGNKLTKSNTVSFRGKANNNLSAYGTKFDYFQKDGIKFGLERKGRILLADEMGVGKTVQAIGIALLYKEAK